MNHHDPLPEMLTTTVPTGELIYSWGDNVVVKVDLHKTERGRPLVTVIYQAIPVTLGYVNLLNLSERETLEAHCHAEDATVDWLAHLVCVAEALAQQPATPTRLLVTTPLSAVQPARIDYRWRPYLPVGRPVGLIGDPGVGKSALVMKIAAHLTTGCAFPSLIDGVPEEDFAPCNVLFFTAEDDCADTLRPRLEANHGDPERLYHVTSRLQDDTGDILVSMQDLALIQQALEQHHPALMVFDPIQSFLGRGVDMNKANETRPVLDALVSLCKQYDCTTLFVRHIGKAHQDKTISLGLGSIDISAAFRSVLVLGYDPQDLKGPRRILAHSKSNTARLGGSIAYKMVSHELVFLLDDGEMLTVEAPRLDWDGASNYRAEDLMSPGMQTVEETTSALQQARDFLVEVLDDGPMLKEEIDAAAKEAGVSQATLRRAKVMLGVKARRRETENIPFKEWPYEWYLPGEDTDIH